jgi:O-antigen/teichoic acid export membrane protein
MPNGKASSEVQELGVSTAKGSVIFVAAQVISSLVTVLLLIGMTRLLMPADFGLYSIAIAFAAFLGMGGNFGIGTALRKMLPENLRSRKEVLVLVNNGYLISGATATVIAIAGVAFSGQIASYFYKNAALALPLEIASVSVFLSVILNTTMGALVGMERIKEASVADILYSTFQLVASVPLVLMGYGVFGAMVGYALGLIIGIAVGLFYLVRQLRYRITSPAKGSINEMVRFSVPIFVSTVAGVGVTNFAVLVLGVFATAATVGNYSAAFRLGSLFTIILSSLTFILLATFSKAFASRNMSKRIEHIYNSSLFYSMIFILPLLAYLIAVAAPMTRLLFGNQYPAAPFYFSVIAFGITLGIIGSFAGTLIISYGDTRKFMYYQIIVIAIEFVLLLLLTPLLKVVGTLIAAFVIAPLVSDATFMMALERQFSIRMDSGRMLRAAVPPLLLWALATLVSIALGQRILTILVDAALVLLLYPPLMIAIKAVDEKDILFMRNVAKSLKGVGIFIEYMLEYAEKFAK